MSQKGKQRVSLRNKSASTDTGGTTTISGIQSRRFTWNPYAAALHAGGT